MGYRRVGSPVAWGYTVFPRRARSCSSAESGSPRSPHAGGHRLPRQAGPNAAGGRLSPGVPGRTSRSPLEVAPPAARLCSPPNRPLAPLRHRGLAWGEGCASPDLVAPAAGRRYGAARERRGGGRGSRAGPASPRLAAAAVAAARRLASLRLAWPLAAAEGRRCLLALPLPALPLHLREGRGEPHAPPRRGG